MKAIQRTVYYCEYCKKHTLSASTTARHEKYCYKNPNNQHRCFDFCHYLLMEDNRTHDSCGNASGCIKMTCTIRDVKMYSYKFEKSYTKPINALEGLERMPLKCDLFRRMNTPVMTDEDYDF